jgi:hypothetical protein
VVTLNTITSGEHRANHLGSRKQLALAADSHERRVFT